ncbi:MAG: DUF2587 domain-containing protein [Actinomycetota bacterium]|nr:DUF2587 domain-containing protein [Actinomycetota bacterium]
MTLHLLPTQTEPRELVRHPEKLVRLAAVARAMLDEVRATPCDAEGCERFRRIYERTLSELGGLLSPDLQTELVYLTVTFETPSPTPSELRIAQAELVGWLEGLLNGIAASAIEERLLAGDTIAGRGEIDSRPMSGQYL